MSEAKSTKKQIGLPMEMNVVKIRDDAGLHMGVLDDGTPFLTGRGLAKLCGVAPSVIGELGANWGEESLKPRGRTISSLLAVHGVNDERLYVKANWEGQEVHAYSDAVCMAVLEYYAFEANKPVALKAFRLLARQSLREFIYERVGYNPVNAAQLAWGNYRDLLSLNAAPAGYFNVLQESGKMIVDAIRNGLYIDQSNVPDISIGKAWATHWNEGGMEAQFGERVKHEFQYPDHYRQSMAEIDAWTYPTAALGEFRLWLDTEYLPKKFPAYLRGKVRRKQLTEGEMDRLIAALVQPLLPEPEEA
jgi:hypothetical protein